MPAFLPFAIAGAGALANVIQGIARSGKAKKLEQKFESLDKALQPVSPEQYAYLNRVRQMQRSMAMGTDPTSAMARRGLAQGLAQTQGNIARVGGGPSTVSGLLRAQQGYGQGMSQIAGNAFQASQGLMQVEQGLIGDIQNAVYGLQRDRRNRAMAEAAQMRQASQDNISAAIGAVSHAATMFPAKEKNLATPKIAPTKEQVSAWTNQINQSLPAGRPMSIPVGLEGNGSKFGEYDYMEILQPRKWGGPSTASELGIQPLR